MYLATKALFWQIFYFLILYQATADVKFAKDQSYHHRFPPLLYRYDSRSKVPDGHMRPFGYQRKPDAMAKGFKHLLTPAEFHQRCVKPSMPCHFQRVLNGTDGKVRTNWTDSYLLDNYGKINVTIEVHTIADKHRKRKKVTLKHFLRNYRYEEMYLRNTLPAQLEKDVFLPPMIMCGTIRKSLTEVVLWMSSGFSPSKMHYDSESQLHCLLDGRKDLVLYDPKFKDIFEFHETYKGSGSGFCPWDPEIINVHKYPKIAKTPWRWATLWPGDCLYLPAGHLHQVRAFSRSLSVATHWFHVQGASSSFGDCPSEEEAKSISVKDARLFWTFIDGDKRIREDNVSGNNLKWYILKLAEKTGKLSFDHFFHFLLEANENYAHLKTEGRVESMEQAVPPREIFMRFNSSSTEFITLEELQNLDNDFYEDLAPFFTPPHTHEPETKDEL